MDPFLESQGYWQDFHFRLIAHCSEILSSRLPSNYAALIEERVQLVDASGDLVRGFRPDVAVVERGWSSARRSRESGSSVAIIEPVSLPLATRSLDEITERWITIRRLPERKLVTVIEVLSPTNKLPRGRDEYLGKREEILKQPVHLVEIDLLLQGRRLSFGEPLPPGSYTVHIEATGTLQGQPWTLRATREVQITP